LNSTTTTLDIQQLIAPIQGDNPAGQSSVYMLELRNEFQELRRQEQYDDFEDATRPEKLKKADWPGIVALCVESLTTKTKDLRVVCHLIEAVTRIEGLPGLVQGLTLLEKLIGEAWNRLNPEWDEADPEARLNCIGNLLDDPERGVCFPNIVANMPIIGVGNDCLSSLEWQRLKNSEDRSEEDRLHRAITSVTTDWIAAQVDLALQAATLNKNIAKMLDDYAGENAPGLLHLGKAIEMCRMMLAGELSFLKSDQDDSSEPVQTATSQNKDFLSATIDLDQTRIQRAEIYRRLSDAAQLLEQIEPHSPAPYLVRRAVELGRLPFPRLMETMIREQAVLSELNRELGIGAADLESAKT
jgi:type VI secretion system protein ImpA